MSVEFETTPQTSARMRKVGKQNTPPEIVVRQVLHRMGYRYRIHRRDLPGHPDVVLARHKAIVFVHGCFWHSHPGCPRATRPASNAEYWKRKLDRNAARDRATITALEQAGWRVLVIWECEAKTPSTVEPLLKRFLVDHADAAIG